LDLTDDANRTVRLEKQPQRLVSLAPSNTEILFALGLGSKVVGVTDFCDYPAETKAITKIGGVKANLEKIASLSPDLVLAIGGAPETVRQLQDMKIAVLVLDPKDIPAVLRDIQLVGDATGSSAIASQLTASMRKRMDDVAARVRGLTAPRVFYELDATDPAKPYTTGPGSWHDQALLIAGGTNVAASAKSPWVQFSVEELLKADPEIILLGDAAYGVSPEAAKSRVGWSGLTASKRNAVYAIDDNLLSRPGPRLADGVEALAKLLHPEAFK
jgi:iron complex transport system substrate-binding protein